METRELIATFGEWREAYDLTQKLDDPPVNRITYGIHRTTDGRFQVIKFTLPK